tara:strand:- start:699 stop:884 length:186 start_codon:yes stop_codon:yes gene_type:complete
MDPDDFTDEPPPISKELIDYLERHIPKKDVRPTDNIDEIMYYGGKRYVVEFLKSLHRKGEN